MNTLKVSALGKTCPQFDSAGQMQDCDNGGRLLEPLKGIKWLKGIKD